MIWVLCPNPPYTRRSKEGLKHARQAFTLSCVPTALYYQESPRFLAVSDRSSQSPKQSLHHLSICPSVCPFIHPFIHCPSKTSQNSICTGHFLLYWNWPPALLLSQVQCNQCCEDFTSAAGPQAPEGHQQGQGAKGKVRGSGWAAIKAININYPSGWRKLRWQTGYQMDRQVSTMVESLS